MFALFERILVLFNPILNPARVLVNSAFAEQDAFSVILCTLLTLCTLWMFQKTCSALMKHGIVGTIQLFFISFIKKVPGGHKLIEAELEKAKQDLIKELKPPTSKHKVYHQLPDEPIEREIIREELLYQLSQEKQIQNKRGHGGIYVKIHQKYNKYVHPETDGQTEIIGIIDQWLTMKEEAYLYFSHSNVLYPFLFPGVRKFDLELIAWCSNLLYAAQPAGNITSGGTESIFCAMNCWRSYGEQVRGIGGMHSGVVPNVVMSKTAHPAFYKACHYLRIEVRAVDIYKDDELFGTVDLKKLEAAVDDRTLCIVGSAPCFPYSVVDDIEGICEIAS